MTSNPNSRRGKDMTRKRTILNNSFQRREKWKAPRIEVLAGKKGSIQEQSNQKRGISGVNLSLKHPYKEPLHLPFSFSFHYTSCAFHVPHSTLYKEVTDTFASDPFLIKINAAVQVRFCHLNLLKNKIFQKFAGLRGKC